MLVHISRDFNIIYIRTHVPLRTRHKKHTFSLSHAHTQTHTITHDQACLGRLRSKFLVLIIPEL